jgi:lactoylglutathione lyase
MAANFMAIQGFSHLGVCVSDLERSTRFYEDVFGFKQVYSLDFTQGEVANTMERSDAFTSRMLVRDDVHIELLYWHDLTPDGDGQRRPMTAKGITHLSFRVDSIDDLFEAAERAGGAVHRQTMSVTAGQGEGARDVELVYLTDPDGVRIECMSGVPDMKEFGL